jgi:hypothetical protein
MLHDLDNAIKRLIYERGNIPRGEIDIEFDPPTRDWASRLSRPALNCWCFDVRENLKLRKLDLGVERAPENQRGMNGFGQAAMRIPPMRLSFTYLVTAWARKVEDEHKLMWRALGALAGQTVLAENYYEGELRDQPFEIPLLVGQMTEAASAFTDLWSVVDNDMHLGFTLQATLALDTRRDYTVPLVLERELRFGQAGEPEGDGRDLRITQRGTDPRQREPWRRAPDDDEDESSSPG